MNNTMENINLIRKIAWTYHHSTGVDWDDLFQEAAVAYHVGLQAYTPDKGKISTYMWGCMTHQLKNYLKSERDYNTPLEAIDAANVQTNPATYSLWESLTDDARDIADLILSMPDKFIVMSTTDVYARIRRVMHRQGWDYQRIQRTLRELETVCQSYC